MLFLLNDNVPFPHAQRGVARYFRYIREGVTARWGKRAAVLSATDAADGAARRIPALRVRHRRQPVLHDVQATLVAAWLHPRVVFHPYYGNARVRASEVFTAYDMIYERFPQHFDPRHPHNARFVAEKRRCFESAARILAISQATARDIRLCYPHLETERIRVVYLGVEPLFFDAPPTPTGGAPYFLYVGHRGLYKNFARLLEAFGRSGLARDFTLQVISPSAVPFTEAERACLHRYGITERVCLRSNVSDHDLHAAYAGATAFVYPSEYEGFGLPILEAMASGTLVATSNVASMPEVGGDVAWYFDPTDPDAIADVLLRLAQLPEAERQARRVAGRARARTFSWQRCQRQTVAVLQELLDA